MRSSFPHQWVYIPYSSDIETMQPMPPSLVYSVTAGRAYTAGDTRIRPSARIQYTKGSTITAATTATTSHRNLVNSALCARASDHHPSGGNNAPGNTEDGTTTSTTTGKTNHFVLKRKRCALCLRKIGIVNSYSCR